MTRKKGYRPLLLLTKTLTLAGITLLVLNLTGKTAFGLPVLQAPFLAAGLNCVIRKRFFTTP